MINGSHPPTRLAPPGDPGGSWVAVLQRDPTWSDVSLKYLGLDKDMGYWRPALGGGTRA